MLFCSNCGKEIDTEQKFCCHCGAENKNYSSPDAQITVTQTNLHPETVNQVNTIFNRNVLNNYLNNLQTLEFAKHKLSEEERNMQYRINSLGHPNRISPRNTISAYGGHIGGIIFMAVVFLLCIWIQSGLNGDGFFSIFDDLLGPIVGFIKVAAVIIAIIIVGVMIHDHIEDGSRFERQTQEEATRLRAERAEKERLSEILPLVKRDLKRTSELLEQAYSINIIPAKYRNIYAAYFLYEYISTSTVSLSEALYHCDLDEISRKLDVIIEQQREIIMELARSNALNEQIIRQNEETLRHAIAAENNTALAAQYSQVAAVNTNTVATIQSYYFFKNGL
ncbi:MAG: zinc ribbon domain-containing protein [Clostridia bacterium]|nr:zinc ribbon domain-containing protein [Clostridia bacterium]